MGSFGLCSTLIIIMIIKTIITIITGIIIQSATLDHGGSSQNRH